MSAGASHPSGGRDGRLEGQVQPAANHWQQRWPVAVLVGDETTMRMKDEVEDRDVEKPGAGS